MLQVRLAWVGKCLRVTSCSVTLATVSGYSAVMLPQQPASNDEIALSQEDYRLLYVDESGIRYRNTRNDSDTLLIPLTTYGVQASLSPDGVRLAVIHRGTDSTYISAISVATTAVQHLHAVPIDMAYTLAWSPDRTDLGVGYYSPSQTEARASTGDVVLIDHNGNARSIGCSMSNRFIAWLPEGKVAVSDGRDYYVVRVDGCATVATIKGEGKSDVSFSPNGEHLLYFETNAVRDRGTGRTRPVRSLHVADYDGGGATVISSFRNEPRQATWSPDGRRIAFVMLSPEYSDITHIGFHDIQTGSTSYLAREEILGLPSDDNPVWSPSGRHLSVDRMYLRSARNIHQKMVFTMLRDGNWEWDVVWEKDVIGATVGWASDGHLAVTALQWLKIVNVGDLSEVRFPPVQFLYAKLIGS